MIGPSSGSATFPRRAAGSTGTFASGLPAGSMLASATSGFSIAQRPRSEIGDGRHSSSDHTQLAGLNEKRTGSPCPMYGGGPVLANACTALPAAATRNSHSVTRSSGLSRRASPAASPSFSMSRSAPIITTAAQ